MAELTKPQQRALRWLYNRSGKGVFTKGQVLMASGDLAGVTRITWNALRDAGYVEIGKTGKGRVEITEAGEQYTRVRAGVKEADCVAEDDE